MSVSYSFSSCNFFPLVFSAGSWTAYHRFRHTSVTQNAVPLLCRAFEFLFYSFYFCSSNEHFLNSLIDSCRIKSRFFFALRPYFAVLRRSDARYRFYIVEKSCRKVYNKLLISLLFPSPGVSKLPRFLLPSDCHWQL